ncbi:hypothetical protein PLESTB_001491300 [Pleodorina starrii]|uniref:Uncharacterized protein n=1 Tax=Pleodorina starrii TaxID=330485 RepID=A0A9W6F7S8_9CHLO|nr:hypothetical protein PLESTB_001491300 [Pleodorina starrii]
MPLKAASATDRNVAQASWREWAWARMSCSRTRRKAAAPPPPCGSGVTGACRSSQSWDQNSAAAAVATLSGCAAVALSGCGGSRSQTRDLGGPRRPWTCVTKSDASWGAVRVSAAGRKRACRLRRSTKATTAQQRWPSGLVEGGKSET